MGKFLLVFLGNLLVPISAAILLVIVVELHPTSLKVLLFFGVLTLIPYYLFEHFINFRSKNFRQAVENLGISSLCSLSGILWAVNFEKIHPDLQVELGVAIIPFLQIGGFLLLRFLVFPEKSSMPLQNS